MEQKKVRMDYKVLTEKISPDNVAEMAELIAMRETRALIGYMGYYAEKAHKRLCRDIFGKNEPGYTFSDSYDLVQSVALFLCGHYGEYLDDTLYISKKGKVVNFLNTIHSLIYDSLIYSVGTKTIKKLMIEHFTADLENDIKKALIAQGEYMLDNGDISLWNGTVITANGTADIKDSKLLYEKIVAPRSVSILMDTNPPLLYMGE